MLRWFDFKYKAPALTQNIQTRYLVLGALLVGGAAIVIYFSGHDSSLKVTETSSIEKVHFDVSAAQVSSETASVPSSTPQTSSVKMPSLPDAHPTGSPLTNEMGGTRAAAKVKVGNKNFNLSPNEVGMFPRVLVPANGKIQISVAYPEGTPNDPLVIQAEDGGLLDNGTVVKQGKLDSNKVISFEFQTNAQDGVYRVTLRKGTDEKRLDFWVGEELALQKGS